jgi:Zn-dependent protease
MSPKLVYALFQLIAFLFAISVHESAHAWMANRRGDPTARMLGRVTLNPIKHIDLFGTIILPLVAMFTGLPVIGWAKPTPVDPRNFKHPVLDDILTAVAGPVSNFLVATIAVLALGGVKVTSSYGRQLIFGIQNGWPPAGNSLLVPLCLLLYGLMQINIVLAVFNLIPVPPLDGSHVVRHFMPSRMLRVYDMLGYIGLLVLVYFGGGLLFQLISPFLQFYNLVLFRI